MKARTGFIWHTLGEVRRNLIDTMMILQAVLNEGNF